MIYEQRFMMGVSGVMQDLNDTQNKHYNELITNVL